jgi:hypothetical protein
VQVPRNNDGNGGMMHRDRGCGGSSTITALLLRSAGDGKRPAISVVRSIWLLLSALRSLSVFVVLLVGAPFTF